MTLDLDALETFFKEDYSPKDLAKLLDDLMYDYMFLVSRQQKEQKELIHENADLFVYYFKRLRDILKECER